MTRITHVSNFPPRPVVDGGTNREGALQRFLASMGARHIVVMDETFVRSRIRRPLRPVRLIREIRQSTPDLVVLCYPSYPFFWQYKVTRYFCASVLFTAALRRAADKQGFAVVVDVADVPAFQYEDLGFQLEMGCRTLGWFDRFILRRADYLWMCSESIARCVQERYGIDESRLITALNGYQVELQPAVDDDSAGLKFAYAGSLNRERGIEILIESFLLGGMDHCELHLCGPYGDWIPEKYKDRRLVCHGSLSDEQASVALSGCHVGLIPYPEKGYYHLAFATKLPFYLGLGMPVLCSNARETASHVQRLGVGLCWGIDDFGSALRHVARNRDQIGSWRRRVLEVRGDFSCSRIYAKALETTTRRAASMTGKSVL